MKRRALTLVSLFFAACSGSEGGVDAAIDAGPTTRDAGQGMDASLDAGPVDMDVDPTTGQITVWQELREELRASPSHRTAEAQRLIDAGDAAAIFAFVRDKIDLRAAANTSFEVQTLWGTQATLRGGLGTPRERVDLLAWMLDQAGFETEVRASSGMLSAAAQLEAMFRRPKTSEPLAPLTDAQIERWSGLYQTPIDVTSEQPIADKDYADSAALSAALQPQVTLPTTPYGLNLNAWIMPYVRFREAGGSEWTNANPNIFGAELGQSYVTGTGNLARQAEAISDTVSIRVWARKNVGADRDEDIEILQKSWTLDEAIGRTATVRFDNMLDVEDLLVQRPQDLLLFFPTLRLTGAHDTSQTEIPGDSGALLSVLGQKIESAGDSIAVDGNVLSPTTTATTEAALRVETIDAVADSSAFPLVKVQFNALDATDARVVGMLGGDFEMTDNGQPTAPLLVRNKFRPRVVFAIDNSGSIPIEFRDGFKDLVLQLAGTLFSSFDAQVMATGVGATDNNNPFVTNLADLESQIDNNVNAGSSAIWGEVAAMSTLEPSLIVLITDADNSAPQEVMTAEMEAQIRSGAPVLVLAVGTFYEPSIVRLAELTETTSIAVANVAEASDAVLGHIDGTEFDYELQYRANPGAPVMRDVQIKLRRGDATGSASYNAELLPTAPRGLVGLYLSVEYDGKVHTRTLAGIAPNADGTTADESHLDEVQGAFFGQYAVTFEGGFLSPAMVYEELLTRRLGQEDLLRSFGDDDALAAAINAGVDSVHELAGFYLASHVVDGGDSNSVPMGVRAMLYIHRPNFGLGNEVREMDLLPFGEWATLHSDPMQGWRDTFDRSLHLAVVEADNFPVSTRSLLANETLIASSAETASSNVPAELRDAWSRATRAYRFNYTVLMPDDGDPVAFWAIHKRTGYVVGVLSEGAGGGRYAAQIARLEARLAFYEQALALLRASNSFSISASVWLQLEYEKAKLVTQSAIAILSLDSDNPPFEPGPALERAGCAIAEQAVGGAIGSVSPLFENGDRLGNAVNSLPGGPRVPSLCSLLLGE